MGKSAAQATIAELVFGTIFLLKGQLCVLMIAHAAFDLTARDHLLNLEGDVARLVFK